MSFSSRASNSIIIAFSTRGCSNKGSGRMSGPTAGRADWLSLL